MFGKLKTQLPAMGMFLFLILIAAPIMSMADAITGGVSFSGGFTLSGGTATNFTNSTTINFTQLVVNAASGSFAPILYQQALLAFNSITYTAFSPMQPQWKLDLNSIVYQFNLNAIKIDTLRADALSLTGTGILYITGFDPTPGIWIMTANNSGGAFSFSAGTNAAVPEPGTLLLLGTALLGIGVCTRRRFN
jgi:hypothetical protein